MTYVYNPLADFFHLFKGKSNYGGKNAMFLQCINNITVFAMCACMQIIPKIPNLLFN